MLVVTTPEISGWEIQRVCGEAVGVAVRSRAMLTQRAPGGQPMYGPELQALMKLLADSRQEAIARMLDVVRAKGGNAVVGLRFDSADLGDGWNELCAYGTAVVAVPVDDAAKATATALGYGQPNPQPTSQPAAAPAAAPGEPTPQQPFAPAGYQQGGFAGYPAQQGYQQSGYPGPPVQQPQQPQQPQPGQQPWPPAEQPQQAQPAQPAQPAWPPAEPQQGGTYPQHGESGEQDQPRNSGYQP